MDFQLPEAKPFPSTPLKLAYWNVRGRTQHVRYVLEAIGIPYDETRYQLENYKEWFERDKQKMEEDASLVLPNLPYLIDEEAGVTFTEHDAIMRYLARRYKPEMQGKTLADQAEVEQFLGFLFNFYLNKCGMFCYAPEPTDEKRVAFVESI